MSYKIAYWLNEYVVRRNVVRRRARARAEGAIVSMSQNQNILPNYFEAAVARFKPMTIDAHAVQTAEELRQGKYAVKK